MNKQKTLQKFQEFNKLLAEQIERSSLKDQEELHWSNGSSWTLMEVLEHLYNVEKLSLKYLEYKLEQGAQFPKIGIRQKYNMWVMKRAYTSSFKYKAPEGVRPKGTYKEIAFLKEDYLELRKNFYSFLKERKETEFDLAMYKTAYFGRVSLYQMIEFFEGHFERHVRQMNRISTDYASSLTV